MSWMFLDGTKFESTDTLHRMASDGRDTWATASNNKIKIYSYWGDSDGIESEIDMAGKISDCYYILKGYDTMYVFNFDVTEFVKIDIQSKNTSPAISIPVSVNCEPEFGNFKLWFVTSEVNLSQSLFYYNIGDGTWSSQVTIPGRHQTNKRIIKWSKNGSIYINQLNENGIARFNDSTGAHLADIPTNRLPQSMYVADNREIIVSGFNGMVTSVDQATNNPSNISGLNAESDSVVDDGVYLWTTQPSISRITKNSVTDNYISMIPGNITTAEVHTDVYFGFGFALNNEDVVSVTSVTENGNTLIEDIDYTFGIDPTFGEQRMVIIANAPNVVGDDPLTIAVSYNYTTSIKDFNIIGFTDTLFKQVDLTPTHTHEYWDGSSIQTKTEPQRIALLADDAIYFGYNLTDSWALVETRNYTLEIQVTGMVGTGPEKYYGETV